MTLRMVKMTSVEASVRMGNITGQFCIDSKCPKICPFSNHIDTKPYLMLKRF